MREDKIAELEEEIGRHRRIGGKGKTPGQGQGQGHNGTITETEKIIALPQGSVLSNYNHSHRSGNFFYTVPHTLYSFLFSPGSIVLQTPILNV